MITKRYKLGVPKPWAEDWYCLCGLLGSGVHSRRELWAREARLIVKDLA